MLTAKALEALQNAETTQLYHLSMVLDRLLSDPKRILGVSRHLHHGQTVRFVDSQAPGTDLRMRQGIVIKMEPGRVIVQDTLANKLWALPYTAIEVPQGTAKAEASTTPPPAAAKRPNRESFRVGDRVSFEDKYLNTLVGTVVRVNTKTISIDCDDGTNWRVGFSLVRPMIDI